MSVDVADFHGTLIAYFFFDTEDEPLEAILLTDANHVLDSPRGDILMRPDDDGGIGGCLVYAASTHWFHWRGAGVGPGARPPGSR
jgi:hypothetical protein